ncbi:MAG TPA: hypothetical protein DHU16_08545 [Gammaproteobacteria bacterium]|nr:hypothetical protein [Gammaproteobacteria bacterium]
MANTDTVERVVCTGNRLALDVKLVGFCGQCVDGCDRVLVARIDTVGSAELFGKSKFLVVKIYRNNWISTGHTGANDRRQPHAADTENRHALAFLYLRSIDYGTGTGHHRTADYGGNVFVDVWIDLHYVLLVSDGVISPGKDVL